MPFTLGGDLVELFDERAKALQEIGQAKGRLAQIEKKIIEFTKPSVDAAFKREPKPYGTVRFAIGNHMLKAVVGRTVDWDQGALRSLALSLPPQAVHELFKIEYSVADAVFKNIIEPDLKAKLVGARTVKYGEPKISLDD